MVNDQGKRVVEVDGVVFEFEGDGKRLRRVEGGLQLGESRGTKADACSHPARRVRFSRSTRD